MNENDRSFSEDALDVVDIQKFHAGYSVSMLVNIE